MTRPVFQVCVEQVLIPTLTPGDIVVMDNLPAHKMPGVQNSIEIAFSKIKALLRVKAERTVTALWNAVGSVLNAFTPHECSSFFIAAGYETD
ncbi:transposase [Acetobacter oeni]|nr:transposase [Acetobacter oeni]NHO20879.1 hypothetical protein [Acetobacter oeni]